MGKVFLVDVAKCNGCYSCQIVCKDEHCGNDWRPYAAPQPDIGQFWLRMDEKTRGQVPWVKVAYKPVMCAHCDDAPCATACPNGAYHRRADGLLLIDPDTCVGCGACAKACPQGLIYMNADLNIAQKCTGCAHLLDNGWDVPRCVDACSHDVIRFVDEEEAGAFIAEAEVLPEVADLHPRVYYKSLPKRFIAGSVVDLVEDELLIGVPVTVKGAAGFEASQETDEFGDFMFEGIGADVYRVCIEPAGYAPVELTVDVTEIDRSVGDIEVKKA